MRVLTKPEIDKLQLAHRLNWVVRQGRLEKLFEFADFTRSIKFVRQLTALAERRNHHPDIHISYNKVTLTLSTHEAGGITMKDIDLARAINRLPDVT